jgi:hypothetical protein
MLKAVVVVITSVCFIRNRQFFIDDNFVGYMPSAIELQLSSMYCSEQLQNLKDGFARGQASLEFT